MRHTLHAHRAVNHQVVSTLQRLSRAPEAAISNMSANNSQTTPPAATDSASPPAAASSVDAAAAVATGTDPLSQAVEITNQNNPQNSPTRPTGPFSYSAYLVPGPQGGVAMFD